MNFLYATPLLCLVAMSTILRSWLCLCCSKSLAMKKLLLTLVILLLLAQCSGSRRMILTNMEGSRPIATTSIEVATRFGNEEAAASASAGTVEDSARLVPTGPDPLHHNNNPLGP